MRKIGIQTHSRRAGKDRRRLQRLDDDSDRRKIHVASICEAKARTASRHASCSAAALPAGPFTRSS
jgi:hypothetical protein